MSDNIMTVEEVTAKKYMEFTENTLVFQTASFLELNKSKVDCLKYLLIKKGESPRFAVCFGIRDSIALCPFSSPCGFPISLKKEMSIRYFDEALIAIDNYAEQEKISEIRFGLPPIFYTKEEITAWINAFYRNGYNINNIDVNFAFDLSKVFVPDYINNIQHNARKNLRIALKSDLMLCKCETIDEVKSAYEVIAENRKSKGYPLRMSLQQVLQTIEIVDNDVFVVKKGEQCVAAALVYRISNDIAQVIYWGDKPGFSELKSINFLSYQLIQLYGNLGFKYLDIGISTVESIPNYGLCEFKESIGCERDLKLTMVKEYKE